jgi:hypothetical protein
MSLIYSFYLHLLGTFGMPDMILECGVKGHTVPDPKGLPAYGRPGQHSHCCDRRKQTLMGSVLRPHIQSGNEKNVHRKGMTAELDS